jgi:hypothetical protein
MGMFDALGKLAVAFATYDEAAIVEAFKGEPGAVMTSMQQGCGGQLTDTDGAAMMCVGHDEKGKCIFEHAPAGVPAR